MANKRALIVDDSTTAQYRLKKMLRRYPLDIDVADSGEAALRYLAHHVPDVIFMDHTMPGMDGFRALQIIKSHPETAMVPVIMYTAQSGDVYTGQARALGALDVVSKDTINATDLSKVMEAIHIYQEEQLGAAEPEVESAELIAAANKVTDINTHRLERRASNIAAQEQARNLELRLSHMEHTLEDNRRFITSRVVRELQALRKNMRDELSDIMQHQQPAAAPALPSPVIQPEEKPVSSWSITGKALSVIALMVIAYLLVQISLQLRQNTQIQEQLGKQLQEVSTLASKEQPVAVAPVLQNASLEPQPAIATTAGTDFINDLAWTFNQNGALAFNQNTIDPKPVLRLHELLHRIASNGFKGTAQITIFVGNFCVSIDNMGMAQLAKPDATLSDCMLSSEIYMLERVMDEYVRETNMILSNLTRAPNSTIQVQIGATEGPDTYPERIPTVSARDWNIIAQNNNRIELTLVPDEPN